MQNVSENVVGYPLWACSLPFLMCDQRQTLDGAQVL